LSTRIRIFIGVTTTVVFVGVGGTMVLEQQTVLGSVLIGLGILRAGVLFRQIRQTRPDPD